MPGVQLGPRPVVLAGGVQAGPPAAGSLGVAASVVPFARSFVSSVRTIAPSSVAAIDSSVVSPSSRLPTGNTSPLTPRIHTWHSRLVLAHSRFCERTSCRGVAGDGCVGVRALDVLLSRRDYVPLGHELQCLQAVEAEDLLHGLYFGFPVLAPTRSPDSVPSFEVENYPCTSDAQATFVWDTICSDLADGKLRELPARPRWVHPLYVRETLNPHKMRIISDFRVPVGASINEQADARKFRMMGLKDAYTLMRPHYFMAKVDVKEAFRTVGCLPEHCELLSFGWTPRGGVKRYFVDTRFPFGLKCSPEIFCRVSQAVRAMMAAAGFDACVVYVDDFLVLGATAAECQHALDCLLRLLDDLGFTISPAKTVLPTQMLVFLGLQLATNVDGRGLMEVTVPAEKLERARALAASLSGARECSRRSLESALGYFQHLATAVYSARAFTRRLVEAIKAAQLASPPRTVVPVTAQMRADLDFWRRFAARFNGKSVVLSEPIMEQGFLATDASGTIGMGGFFNGESFSVGWPHLRHAGAALPAATRSLNRRELWPSRARESGRDWIPYREMFAVWWALLTWGESFRGRTITLHCDNTVVVDDLIRMRARQRPLMKLLRAIFRLCADWDIRMQVVWISSEMNDLADALSRLELARYAGLLAMWRVSAPRSFVWTRPVFSNPGLLTQKAAELQGCLTLSASLARPGVDASGCTGQSGLSVLSL